MTLTSYEIVQQILALLAQRNDDSIADHRCPNCGHELFEPEPRHGE